MEQYTAAFVGRPDLRYGLQKRSSCATTHSARTHLIVSGAGDVTDVACSVAKEARTMTLFKTLEAQSSVISFSAGHAYHAADRANEMVTKHPMCLAFINGELQLQVELLVSDSGTVSLVVCHSQAQGVADRLLCERTIRCQNLVEAMRARDLVDPELALELALPQLDRLYELDGTKYANSLRDLKVDLQKALDYVSTDDDMQRLADRMVLYSRYVLLGKAMKDIGMELVEVLTAYEQQAVCRKKATDELVKTARFNLLSRDLVVQITREAWICNSPDRLSLFIEGNAGRKTASTVAETWHAEATQRGREVCAAVLEAVEGVEGAKGPYETVPIAVFAFLSLEDVLNGISHALIVRDDHRFYMAIR